MNIYIELDHKHEDSIVVKNYKPNFDKNKKLFEEHYIDFSSINLLKGNKELLVKSFDDELQDHFKK